MVKPLYFLVAAVSLDGFIAKFSGHKSDWTSKEDKRHLLEMEEKADVLLLGRISFENGKEKLSKRKCIVLTRKIDGIRKEKNLIFFNAEKADLKNFIEKNGFKKVCVLGGRSAYNYCLEKNLVGEIFLTIEPIVFGKGIPLFENEAVLKKFRLVSVKKLNENGTILLHYLKK